MWGSLVVCDGLYPLPQTPSIAAVTEVIRCLFGVLLLGFINATGQVGPGCPQFLLISRFEGGIPDPHEPVDFACKPRFLVGSDNDRLGDCNILSALGDVGSDSLCVLLEIVILL